MSKIINQTEHETLLTGVSLGTLPPPPYHYGGEARAFLLYGIADPDIVDETIVVALSSDRSGQSKSSFKIGKTKAVV